MNIIYNDKSVHIGSNISGDVIIVNGKVINGDDSNSYRKFDEKKSKDCTNIDIITIYSTFAGINISSSDSSEAVAHVYGEGSIDGDINFNVSANGRELKISLDMDNESFSGNLHFDVTIPKKIFNLISISSLSAKITLDDQVSAKALKINSSTGAVNSKANAQNYNVTTVSGAIKLSINAKQDINANISSTTGAVTAELINISHANLLASSVFGKVMNYHKGTTGYTASINVSTMSGRITIH